MNKQNEVLCVDGRFFFCKVEGRLYRLDMEEDVLDVSKRGITDIFVNGLLSGLPPSEIEAQLQNSGFDGCISMPELSKESKV